MSKNIHKRFCALWNNKYGNGKNFVMSDESQENVSLH